MSSPRMASGREREKLGPEMDEASRDGTRMKRENGNQHEHLQHHRGSHTLTEPEENVFLLQSQQTFNESPVLARDRDTNPLPQPRGRADKPFWESSLASPHRCSCFPPSNSKPWTAS